MHNASNAGGMQAGGGSGQSRMLFAAFGLPISANRKLLEAGCMGYIVEHALHCGGIERGRCIEGWNAVALGVADRAEVRVALQTRIELVGLVQVLMHTRCSTCSAGNAHGVM